LSKPVWALVRDPDDVARGSMIRSWRMAALGYGMSCEPGGAFGAPVGVDDGHVVSECLRMA